VTRLLGEGKNVAAAPQSVASIQPWIQAAKMEKGECSSSSVKVDILNVYSQQEPYHIVCYFYFYMFSKIHLAFNENYFRIHLMMGSLNLLSPYHLLLPIWKR